MKIQLCFALGLAGLSLAPLTLSQNVLSINKVPDTVERTAQQLTHSLEWRGYDVLRGYFKLMTTEDCKLSYEVMHTCYANNPAAPYVIPIVPPWPDEWVDPATVGALGLTVDGYNGSYRLDPREALVIVAKMPPPASFFSEKTYLFTRAGDLCNKSSHYDFVLNRLHPMLGTFFSLVPQEPGRVEIIADLTNNPNSVIMANTSGDIWDQIRYFVITPNPAIDASIRKAFVRMGIPSQYVFTEKIPGFIGSIPYDPERQCPPAADLRFGLNPQADDFVTVLRYAMPVDEAAGDQWRKRLPLVVLRVRNLEEQVDTYPWEPFDQRTPSVPPETSYSEPLTTLAQAVCDSWNKPGTTQNCTTHDFLNMQTNPMLLTGPACIPDWMNCIAPSEDSTYSMSGKIPLDSEHFYAVVGPLSTETDNATYVGLGLNKSLQQLGFDNISDYELKASAKGYSNQVPDDKFYVQYFARNCNRLKGQLPAGVVFNCKSIGNTLPYCYNTEDLSCNILALTLRAYIRPGTYRAADKNSVLNPKFMYLQIPKK